MAFNLLDSVKSLVTSDLVDKASSQFGENASDISKAVSAGIPVLLSGIISKAETGDADAIVTHAKEMTDSNLLANPGMLLTGGPDAIPGMNWLGSLFGGGQTAVVQGIGNFAGIKQTSVSGLLGMIGPVILGVLGRYITSNNLSAGSLTSFLSGQKQTVTDAMPAGLNLGRWLNVGTAGPSTAATNTTGGIRETVPVGKPAGNRILPILLIIAAAIILVYFLSRGCNNQNATTAVTDTTTQAAAPAAPVTTERESLKVKLADNTEIDAYKGGIEDKLVACLNDAACKPGKDKWFDFDNINFETGSAKLTAESQQQISNIIAILKAYPKMKIKIGGYTDITGDSTANKKLSQDRAETVATALKANTNTSQIVGAEGYGSEFAKVPITASDEERKVDRRIAVQLRDK